LGRFLFLSAIFICSLLISFLFTLVFLTILEFWQMGHFST
jgi:hypothetical protein